MRAADTYRSARRAAAIATRAILRKMKREEKAAAYAKNGLKWPARCQAPQETNQGRVAQDTKWLDMGEKIG